MNTTPLDSLRLVIDPAEVLRAQGLTPDPWQRRFLLDGSRRVMLLCCRGVGKSHATSARVFVAEVGLEVKTLCFSPADLAALAEAGATREDIANAFNVPLSFLSPDTNLANIQSSRELHALVGVRRRDQKLNEQLVRLYDPTGRLFLESDDPLPDRDDYAMKQEKQDLDTGVRSINEVRAERGLPPAPWGDAPWLPITAVPTDLPLRADLAPRTGRNRDPQRGEDA